MFTIHNSANCRVESNVKIVEAGFCSFRSVLDHGTLLKASPTKRSRILEWKEMGFKTLKRVDVPRYIWRTISRCKAARITMRFSII